MMRHATLYTLTSFGAGFALMTLELVSARVAAPFIGNSVFMWTSVIGVTLAGLSVGSVLGGKIADIAPRERTLAYALLMSAFATAFVPVLARFGDVFVPETMDIIVSALLLSFSLFFFPAIALGSIQPIILKLYAQHFTELGWRYGMLSALWSTGSIAGVFVTGFYFVGALGSSRTLLALAAILFVLSAVFFLSARREIMQAGRIIYSIIILVSFGVLGFAGAHTSVGRASANVLYDDETRYYRTRIAETDVLLGGSATVFFLDFDSHSIVYKNPANKPLSYTDLPSALLALVPDPKRIYAIGGGAYNIPRDFAQQAPRADIVVSEIDPEVTRLAERFFGLDRSRIKTISADGRVALRGEEDASIDLIVGDAYNSFVSVPWHLLTDEWNILISQKLSGRGVYMVNFISAVSGENARLYESVYATLARSFPTLGVFAFGQKPEDVQNIVLLAGKTIPPPAALRDLLLRDSKTAPLASVVIHPDPSAMNGYVLTDDYAPIETLMIPAIREYFPSYLAFFRSVMRP